jgi:hypothetical protein
LVAAVGGAATSVSSSSASSHPSRLRLPKILRSCHTLTSFAQLFWVLSSPVFRSVCRVAQDMIGHSASIHSEPFLREFCITSFARYRKLSLRLGGAARSSRCHAGARILARLRWNTHQCESVSMLCDVDVSPASFVANALAI